MSSIIVANSKGGVGKTTASIQLFGSYFLYKDKDVIFNDFDDVNQDGQFLEKSRIVVNSVSMKDEEDLFQNLNDILLGFESNQICDVGGNKTCEMFLKNLARLPALEQLITAFVIPLSAGISECQGAIKLYDELLKINFPIEKIYFVLTRSLAYRGNSIDKNNRLITNYLEFFEKFGLKNKTLNSRLFIMPFNSCFIGSMRSKMTIYEMALNSSETIKSLDNKLFELVGDLKKSSITKDDSDISHIRSQIMNLNAVKLGFEDSKDYFDKVLLKELEILDEVIDE